MRWIMALSDGDGNPEQAVAAERYYTFALRALRSAWAQGVALHPVVLFNGEPNSFTTYLHQLGVSVLFHRPSFNALLHGHAQVRGLGWLRTAKGAYLRLCLPELFSGTVLYTDADIMFTGNLQNLPTHCGGLAVAPEFELDNFKDFNSGVMLMNLDVLRPHWPAFMRWTLEHLLEVPNFDQGALKWCFRGRHESLNPIFNWKPYWGVNPLAQIVHFHGPKPPDFYHQSSDPRALSPEHVTHRLWRQSPQGYAHYVNAWFQLKA